MECTFKCTLTLLKFTYLTCFVFLGSTHYHILGNMSIVLSMVARTPIWIFNESAWHFDPPTPVGFE